MKIAVLKGCRSDSGLIGSIQKRLDWWDMKFFDEVDVVRLVPSDYMGSYAKMDWYLKYNTPDLVIIPGDRIEMMAGATCCFMYGVPIAHVYGGIRNTPLSTVDDIFRHNISLMSELVFVENERAMRTVNNLFYAIEKSPFSNPMLHRVTIIGNLYMCDYEIDESTVPDEPYCLVLYNAFKNCNYAEDTDKIHEMVNTKRIIVIKGNPDSTFYPKFYSKYNVTYNENLPRSIFLGLLKNCQRFITNSSSAYYEAPTFLKPEQIILIGNRNKNRSSTNLPEGKPDVVIETIKAWWRKR